MRYLLPLVFVWTLHNGVRVFDGFEDVTAEYYGTPSDQTDDTAKRSDDARRDEQQPERPWWSGD